MEFELLIIECCDSKLYNGRNVDNSEICTVPLLNPVAISPRSEISTHVANWFGVIGDTMVPCSSNTGFNLVTKSQFDLRMDKTSRCK